MRYAWEAFVDSGRSFFLEKLLGAKILASAFGKARGSYGSVIGMENDVRRYE